MTSSALKRIGIVLVLLCLPFLAACDGKRSTRTVVVTADGTTGQDLVDTTGTPDSPSTPKTGGLNFVDGPSDTGGGTGVDGKVFESYIVDVTSLPAYQQVVLPLLRNIKGEDPDEPNRLETLALTKTWYVAPVDLGKIGKTELGIEFVGNNTIQIARQTRTEVWIDSHAFEKMDVQAQGELILHELVMSLYFLKFRTFADLCKLSEMVDKDKPEPGPNYFSCDNFAQYFDQDDELAPEPFRNLNDEDNERIRFVTGWILTNAKKEVPMFEFNRIAFGNGFDRRLFKEEGDGRNETLPVSYRNVFKAMLASDLAGPKLTQCTGVKTGIVRDCKLEFKESSEGFLMRLTVAEENLVIEYRMPLEGNMMTDGVRLKDGFQTYWQDSLRQSVPLSAVKVGDVAWGGSLALKGYKNEKELTLAFIKLRPDVVVSLDDKNYPRCDTREMHPVSFKTDTIYVHPKGTPYAKELLRNTTSGSPISCEAGK